MLIDTHCHIHEADYTLAVDEVLRTAAAAGVSKMICVGTSEQSSLDAVTFAAKYDTVYSSIGVHPHNTKNGWKAITPLFGSKKLVAVGEIGLDYFYDHSPRDIQIAALEAQIQLALDHNLPIIFHVREAFTDFWPIFDNFHGIRGVLHSFTDTQVNMNAAFERNLYIGVNGISTFTRDSAQQKMYASMSLDRMLLETDAPFLTPVPHRGTINQPAFVSNVAKFQATIRGSHLDDVASATTANANTLFSF